MINQRVYWDPNFCILLLLKKLDFIKASLCFVGLLYHLNDFYPKIKEVIILELRSVDYYSLNLKNIAFKALASYATVCFAPNVSLGLRTV